MAYSRSAGTMPRITQSTTTIHTCKHPRCTTCQHYNTTRSFKSTTKGRQYTPFTCNSKNLIYLISNNVHKMQETTRRINRHLSNIRKSIHPDHNLKNLSVQAIALISPSLQELKGIEKFWILSLQPKGLNVSI